MKKEYEKPQMMVENFMVSDFIATCNDMLTFAENSQCSGNRVSPGLEGILNNLIQDGNFTDTTTGCIYPLSQDDFFGMYEGTVCKHTPTGEYQVFAS